MSSDILLNLLLNPFFHVRAEEEVPVHAISLGLCENVEVSLAKQCSDLLSKTQPLYMKSFLLCVTWLQRGAVSRQPGNKIIAPVLREVFKNPSNGNFPLRGGGYPPFPLTFFR